MPGLREMGALGLALAAMLLGTAVAVAAPAQFVSADAVAGYDGAAQSGSDFALRLPIPARVDTAVAEDLANYRIYPIDNRVWPDLHAARVIASADDGAGIKTVVVWGGFAPSTTYAIRFAYSGGTLSFAAATPHAAAASGAGDLPLLTRFMTVAVDPLDQRDPDPPALHVLHEPDADRPGVRYRTSVTVPDPLHLARRIPGGQTGSSLAVNANGMLGDHDADTGALTSGSAVLSFSHRHDFEPQDDRNESPRHLSAAAHTGAAPTGLSFGTRVIPVGLEISQDMERLVYRSRIEMEGSAPLLVNWFGATRARSDGGGINLHSVVGYTVRHVVMAPTNPQTQTTDVVDGEVSVAVPLGRTLDLDSRLRAQYGADSQDLDGTFETGLQYAVDRDESATLSLTYSNDSWPEDFEEPGAIRLGFRMKF